MKNIYILKVEECSESLLTYPCKDPNSLPLDSQTVVLCDKCKIIKSEWLKELGATVYVKDELDGEKVDNCSIGIITPETFMKSGEEVFHEVLDFYISTIQVFIKHLKNLQNIKHLIVILPARSDEYSTEFSRMAYYAIYGLIRGLGKMYATNNLYVNGIILNEKDPLKNLKERIQYLASNNSCNTVGQIFKL